MNIQEKLANKKARKYVDCYGNAWGTDYDARFATALYTGFDTQPHSSNEEIVQQLLAQFPEEHLDELRVTVDQVRDGWPHSTEGRLGKGD